MNQMKTVMRIMIFTWICLGVVQPAAASDNSCFEEAGHPGCSDPVCQTLICGTVDSFCCDAVWDGLCVLEANHSCTEPVMFEPDHYLSYRIKHKVEVFLEDQFGGRIFELGKAEELLNPANKNDEGITDAATHLIAYKVKGPDFEEIKGVLVQNQFGYIRVDVKKPDRLLVPASKSLSDPVSAPENTNLDHFLCYKVQVSKGSHFPKIEVRVADQFNNQPKLFELKEPKRLCNPTAKEYDGPRVDIKNPENHLLCYNVKPANDQPEHERIEGIFVNDQFGPGRVETRKEKELCVPSTKPL